MKYVLKLLSKLLPTLILLLFLSSCKKKNEVILDPIVISQPVSNQTFGFDDVVEISGNVNDYKELSGITLLLNDLSYSFNNSSFYKRFNPNVLAKGRYKITVKATYEDGEVVQKSLEFEVNETVFPANQLESFNDSFLGRFYMKGWQLSEDGYDDDYCLTSETFGNEVSTRFRFSEAGHISFYVKSEGKMEFYINRGTKSVYFPEGDWKKYHFSVEEGEHVFKWHSNGIRAYIDNIEFVPGEVKYSVGERLINGLIFHLDESGQHGLIARRFDDKYHADFTLAWGCYGTDITSGNQAKSRTDGFLNTQAVMTDCSGNNAFKAATWWGPENTWYIPSIEELKQLYAQNAIFTSHESLSDKYYWSSTSMDPFTAMIFNTCDLTELNVHRTYPTVSDNEIEVYTRAIRKF